MKAIWKFPITIEDAPVIDMPQGAVVLSAERQRDQFCLWALVNPKAPKEPRRFRVFGTGQPLDDAVSVGDFIGSVLTADHQFVWHIFEAA